MFKTFKTEQYLDDIILAALSHSFCLDHFYRARNMCDLFGISISIKKPVVPSTIITYVGIQINTLKLVASPPQGKLDKLKNNKLHGIIN